MKQWSIDDRTFRILRQRHGMEGYGVAAYLLDLLSKSKDSTLPCDYDDFAFDMDVEPSLVKSVVEDLGFFTVEEGVFFYQKMREYRESISKSRRKAIMKRWGSGDTNVSENDTNVLENDTNVCGGNTNVSENDTIVCKTDTIVLKTDTIVLKTDTNVFKNDTIVSSEEESPLSSPPLESAPIPPKDIPPLLFPQEEVMPISQNSTQKKQSPRARAAPSPEAGMARKVFESHYKQMFDNDYYWTAKDAGSMKSLLNKIKFSRSQRGLPVDVPDVMVALKAFLDSIDMEDSWILEHYNVSYINGQYNEIVLKAKQRKNGKASRRSDFAGTHTGLIHSIEERESQHF